MPETIESANAAASTLFLGHNGEWWDLWLIVAVGLAALAGIAIGITTTGSIVSHKREAESAREALERFKLDTKDKISDAEARAAEAKAQVAKSEERLQKFRMDRRLFFSDIKCKDALRGKRAGKAEIIWKKNVHDARWLADGIAACLAGDTGLPWWKIDSVRAVDELPREARATGVTVIAKKVGMFVFKRPSDELGDIVGAAVVAGSDSDVILVEFGVDPAMPDDLVIIAVGDKE